jgi:hypothetical protein
MARATVTEYAGEEKDCPQGHACPSDEFSGQVPIHNRHRGGPPENVDVNQRTCGNKNDSEHEHPNV